MTQEIINSSESRCSFKIESNSRGNNYTTHIYGQCSQEEINDCIAKTIKPHNEIQREADGQGEIQQMQASDSTFVCDSCENELALEEQCDHDPKTVHHWCIDCCSNVEKINPIQWDDLH